MQRNIRVTSGGAARLYAERADTLRATSRTRLPSNEFE
ncbi:hypothetical protein FTUN_0290 [Frigoriglobus tundricola]|uniref:Uncharacterized protein n=1 Tax=Frigoriglobus tundricola TaxID=2774151 RepID=A0A6M5YHQ6_9BACT|nr:hypothetical protein FTUN_0290 [Frigoriglobus tundricola]